jgi:hypothetical protein
MELIFLLCAIYPLLAKVIASPIFGDNMVIQQDTNIPVWGLADK